MISWLVLPLLRLGRGNSSFRGVIINFGIRVLDVDMLTEVGISKDDMGVGSMFVSWSCWVEDFLMGVTPPDMGTGWIEVGDDGTIVVVDMDTSGTWGWIDFLIVIEVDGNMVVVVVVDVVGWIEDVVISDTDGRRVLDDRNGNVFPPSSFKICLNRSKTFMSMLNVKCLSV